MTSLRTATSLSSATRSLFSSSLEPLPFDARVIPWMIGVPLAVRPLIITSEPLSSGRRRLLPAAAGSALSIDLERSGDAEREEPGDSPSMIALSKSTLTMRSASSGIAFSNELALALRGETQWTVNRAY